ncbi:MAG: LUD domain-containing protein [Peptococcaceae bacterium]|jgi:L-lactate utilization protein LutB|nr:LUD domain-containing protein [Peptococcaceae bacterium]MDH7524366.1 LUD domain-containing protein [Peptococcaceae bacterium]
MGQEIAAAREKTVKGLPEMVNKACEKLIAKGCRVYFAADRVQARGVLAGLLKGQRLVARSYSKTLREIGFDELTAGLNIKSVRTCAAEMIMDRLQPHHPGCSPFPFTSCSRDEIYRALREELGENGAANFDELRRLLHKKIRGIIIDSESGVTGANGIAAESGTLILAEEEGNARNVSNLPPRHIAVAGIEKIYGNAEEALAAVCSAAAHGTGRKTPACISLISGPSRTGDIGFRLVYGMHGPGEVHVVLLDNGRRFLLEQGLGDMLKCVDCGACLVMCRQMALENGWTDLSLTMKGICLALVQGRIKKPEKLDIYNVTCPAGIAFKRFKQVLLKLGEL